jgi:hypothetical protein
MKLAGKAALVTGGGTGIALPWLSVLLLKERGMKTKTYPLEEAQLSAACPYGWYPRACRSAPSYAAFQHVILRISS